jgi:hypothetical protein
MRNFSNKSCRENQNAHHIFFKFFPKIVLVEIMSKNMQEPERPQMKFGGA